MDKISFRKAIPYLSAIVLFLLIPSIYFSPQLDGKKLNQHDTNTATGMAKEIVDYNRTHNDIALWTNSMFGGMPAYLIGFPTTSILSPIYKATTLFDWRPISFVFLYLLGFYLALLLFGVNPWLSIVGAIAFGFSSYDFIIIAAGHNTKAIAIGYMAPLIGGLYHAFKKNLWVGSCCFAIFLALQIYANHLQITYYTLLTILIFGMVELYFAFREKLVPEFLKKAAVISLFALLAIAANTERLWTTYEYGKFSLRGASELTSDKGNKTSGLDKDYATGWSYGVDETMTLLIPNFKGGASVIDFGQESSTAEILRSNNVPNANSIVKQLPGYWGSQPGTSGPVYFGAIILFLFVLALFLTDGPLRIWIISATIFSILLSWGRNFMPLTDFFLDYFPGYNKFRTVSMILVIAGFTVPLLSIIGLQKILTEDIDKEKWNKALLWSVILTAGVALLFFILPGLSGSFISANDAQMPDWIQNSLIADRKAFLRQDALRTIALILAAAVILWTVKTKKLKANYALIILGTLILIDMWGVNKRYLNNDNFVQEQKARNPYPITNADKEILKDKSEYRVLNLTVDPFNDASTSFYHQSIGGYHGAKMRRYQELIDFHIGNEIQLLGKRLNSMKTEAGVDSLFLGLKILNMLNTKYLIYNPSAPPFQNNHVNGSVWLVKSYKLVANADEEIATLKSFRPEQEIIADQKYKSLLSGLVPSNDSSSKISLKSYSPNQLVYSYSGKGNEIAVFSEIFYPKGWNAYINNKIVPHFQANYVLRAMVLSPGDYDITFKFEPASYELGKKISLVASFILLLIIGYVLYKNVFLNPRTTVKIKE